MKIIPLSAEFSRIADVNQEIEELGRGYGGSIGPAEGPVWIKDGSYLLFSDIHNNRRMRWTNSCLLYTSPSPRDATLSRMPSSA